MKWIVITAFIVGIYSYSTGNIGGSREATNNYYNTMKK